MYGLGIEASVYNPQRDVIGKIERTASGNTVLRIGREVQANGWTQVAHVVLTPDEAAALSNELYEASSQKGNTAKSAN